MALNKLIFVILINEISTQLLYNYPFNCKNEVKLTLDGLQCPLDYNTFNLRSDELSEVGTMCRPNPLAKDLEDGFLCYKDTWVTKCSESWYFSKTISNHIVHEPISKSECIEALATYKMGKHVEPFFPAPSCYWAADNEETVTFINIKEHPVILDPYSGKIKDPLIDNNLCDDDFCPTRAHQTHWLRNLKPNIMERCNNDTWECHPIKVYYGWVAKKRPTNVGHDLNYVQTGLIIESQYIGHIVMSDLCTIKFCSKLGYLFPDGSWWELKFPLDHLLLKNHQLLENSGSCSDRSHGDTLTKDQRGNKIGYEDLEVDLEGLELRQKSRNLNLICLDKVANIRNRKEVNILDISYLTPKHPGHGTAYYLYEDTSNASITHVKAYSCNYKLIQIHGADMNGRVNMSNSEDLNITILDSGDNMTIADLGISKCKDLSHLTVNQTRNISCEKNVGFKYPEQVKLSNGKVVWTSRSFGGANFHRLPGVRFGVNGITYDLKQQMLRFPTVNNLLWDLPSYYSTNHKVHFYTHPTKHEIRKNFTGERTEDIDFLDDLIHRKLNRTDFPTKVRNWIGDIENKVVHFFSNVGGTIKTAISLIFFVIGTLISIKIWRKCKKCKGQSKRSESEWVAKKQYTAKHEMKSFPSNFKTDNIYEDVKSELDSTYSPFHV
ncbi:glycoprotein [Sweetwater Branch virus]|uniref:Glycoprotein n=1 Tax=Sweetwater Branch virus TaxID=1272958 RepID=A0A0D3R120_9RHAB|nr:glycoprotein [Sweetwater Branch virus]AJR28389.1 glycoprotein [Sweetwater Branch virus]